MSDAPGERLARVVREESGRILAGLIGRLGGDFERAEDAFQEACASALEHWPREGVPENPGAWLATVSVRKAIDAARAERPTRRTATEVDALVEDGERSEQRIAELEEAMESSLHDDLLRLVFTCCHPALAEDARIALTLRTLGGLSTAEVARAFLVPEATIAQRLVRAQRKIHEARIPYRVPREEELAERLESVLAVVYLVFNEGYSASSGPGTVRGELCDEALRLARVLARLLPHESEVHGLLALLLLQDSRREARLGPSGDLVLLDAQDRKLWNRVAIAEGERHLERAWRGEPRGPYTLQAAIAAEHARAAQSADTDWRRIVELYDELLEIRPTAVVALNRAAAVAMAEGPSAGLEELARIEARSAGALADYLWLHTLRGELLLRLERRAEARAAFERALALAGTAPERRHLAERISRSGS
jgi:RNA polymerase sigma-70 factor (ECF subfamily)